MSPAQEKYPFCLVYMLVNDAVPNFSNSNSNNSSNNSNKNMNQKKNNNNKNKT